MSHFLNRTKADTRPVAVEAETPQMRFERIGIERHQGTTRAPRPRVLKPPIG